MNMNFIKKGMPLLFLAAPLPAASALSYLSSRAFNRSAQITLEQSKTVKQLDQAASFAAFSDRHKLEVAPTPVAADAEVLAFLEQNNLLHPTTAMPTNQSGDLGNDFSKRFSQLVFLCDPDYYSTSSGCRIASITRQTPATSPTDADSLTWSLLFDVPVSGVGATDFALTGTTATITSVVQNTTTDYSLTVSGGDLASLNGTVSFELNSTYDIRIVKTGALMDTRGDDGLNDGGADAVNGTNNNSYLLVNSSPPTVTDANISISGASGTGGAYKIGDTVTATWNNTVGGNNNVGITGVTVDFSQFGGGAAVVATNSSETWTATYTIVAGLVDTGNRNISVTATNATGPTTLADSTNATVDSVAPVVSNASIGISGATGTGGAYKIGDTVTASWDNSAIGDDNSDIISGVTVNFSAFGGGAAVVATNSSGTWTATYTIVAGGVDAANRNVTVTATDNAGNTRNTADTTNATVDSVAPYVSNSGINISGGTGTGGAYKIGDTVTATWDNSAIGDDNADIISSVTVNFAQFGGGAAVVASNSSGTWTATYSIIAGVISASNRNVAVTATDNAGNSTTTGDTTNATLDQVMPMVTSVTASTANGTYKAGDVISVQVNFSEAVTVTGTPQITLDTGSIDQVVNYSSGSGTSTLTFNYTVQSGDTSVDLDYASENALAFNGGSIRDAAANNANITLASPGAVNSLGANKDLVLDGTAPSISSINRVTTAFSNASSVDYTVTFSEDVTGVDTTDFTLTETGTADGTIASITPVSASVYTLTVNTITGDGTVRTDLKSSGTGITDAVGNAIATGFTSGQTYTFDHTAPTVSSVSVPANATYINGDNLDFTVNFSENITVDSGGGTPRLTLTVGATSLYADYLSGSGTNALTFRYTVATGHADNNGIALGTSLDLNGGTLRDAAGNNSVATLNAVASTASVLVDAASPTVTSVTVPADATYMAGNNLDFVVNFTESVTVITGGGTPFIALTLNTGGVVNAQYLAGSGTSAITFRYTVATGNLDGDGIAVGALDLNGGTMKDAAGNDIVTTLNAVGSTAAVLIDAVVPTVISVTVPADATYIAGNNLDFVVNFTESVTVNTGGGTPFIALTLNTGGVVNAQYLAGSGTSAITFRYTVATGNLDSDGVTVGVLDLNGGTMKDTGGNDVVTTLNAVGSTAAVLIDAVAPTVISVTVPANATYMTGNNLDFVVNFTENVTVNSDGGTPHIALTLNTGGVVNAQYLSGSGTSAITFRYTVIAGNLDNDGVAVGALNLNGGTMKDAGGNNIATTLNAIDTTAGVLIDAVVPVITDGNIAISGATGIGGAYKIGDTVTASWNNTAPGDNNGDIASVSVDFSQFGGGAAVAATESSGTWTANYTILAGVIDTVNRNVSVTVTDSSGNASTLADTTNATLDDVAPVVSDAFISVSGATGNNGVFVTGDTITATWDNTAGGDNNLDTIGAMTVDFSQFDGGAAVAATNTSGLWTASYAIVAGSSPGPKNISVSVTDNAGNLTTLADTTNSNLDNQAPAAPVLGLELASDCGIDTSDRITNDNTPTVVGTSPIDTRLITLYDTDGTTVLGTDIDVVCGVWGITSSTLADGTHSLTAKGSDAAGNQSVASAVLEVVIDTVMPATPAAPDLDVASDTGTSDSDNMTSQTLPVFSGTVEANSRVSVSSNIDGVLGTAIASGSGVWTFTPGTALSATTHDITLTVEDVAGNITVASPALGLTIDTTAPAVTSSAPDGAALAADASVSFNLAFDDTLYNIATADFSLTATGTASGTIASVSAVSGSSVTVVVNGISGTGTLRVDVSGGGINDLAGNAVAAFTTGSTHTVDRTAPVVTSVAFDQVSVDSANQNAISLTLAGAETGTTANYAITSSNGGTPVTGSTAINAAAQQLTGINVSGLNDGTLTVSLTLTDTAGNISSPAVTDTLAKDANIPAVDSVAIANGNFRLGDLVSASVTLGEDVNVSGTNSTVAIEIGGVTRLATFVSENAGVLTFSYSVQADENTDGNGVTLLASSISLNGDTVRDSGNNDASLTFAAVSNAAAQVDTIAPVNAVVVDPALALSVNTPDYTIRGTHSENGVVINLYADADNNGAADNATAITSATVSGGVWDLAPILTANSSNNYLVIAEDAAGNSSAAIDVPTLTHDDMLPAVPGAVDLAAASDSGSSDTDNITNVTTPTITGTAEANATVTLTSDVEGVVGSIAADGSGNWSITASTLTGGEHSLTAIATDAAGNPGSASSALVISVDTTVPSVSAVADQNIALGGNTGALAFSPADNLTSAADISVTSDSSNATVVPLANVVLEGSGANRSVTVAGAASGSSTVTLTLADAAGNTVTEGFVVMVNAAPMISGTPATSVNQDTAYSFVPAASDIDDDGLIFSIANQPAWASFNTATGALTGVPTRANVGSYNNIVISVTDGTVSASLATFALEVVYVNAGPTIGGTPATSVDQDTAYSFAPIASDTDTGDTLGFSVANLPAWASFDPATGALTGTPTRDDVGDYNGIVISVSDGTDSASLPGFNLSVGYVNALPVISGMPATSVMVDSPYSFTPTATDSDGDTLTFSAPGLPGWLSLDATTGEISGTPGAGVAGMSYNITLSVSDGLASATLPVFTLLVDPFVDPLAPVVTAPDDITINALGLYTPITLRQLLNLPPGTNMVAIQAVLDGMASDSQGGSNCCVTRAQGLFANLALLPPGRHELVWQATNAAGLSGEAVQVINVRPLVSFSKSQVAVKGSSAEVRILLNGASPFYPLEIPYVIDPASTAIPGDHDLVEGIATFTEGTREVVLNIQLATGGTPGNSRLILNLDDRSPRSLEPLPGFDPANPDIYDINAGAANAHQLNIIEGNALPTTRLVLSQGGVSTGVVSSGAGLVTATALVDDPNAGDSHSFDWSTTDQRLLDTDSNASNDTFVFDPAGQSGLRILRVVTTDSAGGSNTRDIYLLILPSLPVLTADDTDGDGLDDQTEGTADSSGNGIPDYLDNMPSSNVLPQVILITDAYLIECDPGVLCGIGQFALGGGSGGVQILDGELGTTSEVTVDEEFTPVGGIFDFVIRDLPTAGQSVRIVIPQQAAIPANAVYRKFNNGEWVNFVENATNTLHSAPGNPGYCPPPGDESWVAGLVEGNFCVQLTLEDGGPNDTDGLVNAAIADPGAVSAMKATEPPPPPPPPSLPEVSIKSKGGGAIDWPWLLMGGALVAIRRYRSGKLAVLLVLAVLAGTVQAREVANSKGYLGLKLYQARGDQGAGDFSGSMAKEGYSVELHEYDISRFAYRLSVGWAWTEATAIELGYLDLGDVTVNLDVVTADMAGFSDAFADHYPISAEGVTLSHRFAHQFNREISLSGEVGVFWWDGKIGVKGADIDPDMGSGIDPLVGVQLDYRISDPLSLGVGLNRVFFSGQAVDLIGFNSTWRF